MLGTPQSISNNQEYGRYAAESIIVWQLLKLFVANFVIFFQRLRKNMSYENIISFMSSMDSSWKLSTKFIRIPQNGP